ncbi:MAG: glycosyltransferase family 4 protein [Verrucomicrobia bacterium]|nr:glycosyltransferase family 4 protein [Verrucomicrobiota bacterium]
MTILHVFNRYLQAGGEETAVEQIQRHVALRHEVPRCFFDSHEWTEEGAPNKASQALRFFYNPSAKQRFEKRIHETRADVAMFHNVYPVGSPALYHSALQNKLPVIQYLHNYRPFSVDGSLFYHGQPQAGPMHGKHLDEVLAGAWQGSVLRSAVCALMLAMLRRSGWLKSVSAWIAISEFMKQRFLESGLIPPHQILTLRHSWDAMPAAPAHSDAGYYLFLGRLIPEKGLHALVSAWHELKNQLGSNTPVLKIAGDGPLAAWIKDQCAINSYMEYLGQISGQTKQDALLHCRALIAPSIWWEPLGLIVYEAYDFAKPVMAARAGGLTETVQHEITGLQHDVGNASDLARSVLQMQAISEDQRREMGQAGRSWLLREAGVTAWQDRFDGILASVA